MIDVITREDIDKHNKGFLLKWANDVEKQDGVDNPSWKKSSADNFFVEMDNQTSIINDARFIVMDAVTYDISYLRVKARLQYMGGLTGSKKGKQLTDDYTSDLTETVPEFYKNELNAVPFSAFTWTPKTFLVQNIEKASFLPKMESLLAERAGYSAELIGMYGIKKASGATQDGMDHLDGIFKQATDIKTAYTTAQAAGADPSAEDYVPFDPQTPMGYYDDIVIGGSASLITQMQNMLTQFSIQKGNRSNAKFYVSNLVYGLLTQEAGNRQTGQGDAIFFNGTELTIWNTPIVVADFMDTPENDFGEQVLLADPDSIVFGFLDEIKSENSYEHKFKAYLSSVDVYFDVLILWNKDVLVAKVTTSSPIGTEADITVNVGDGTNAINGASVVLIDSDNLSATKTTSNGKVEFTDIDNGEYTINVSKDNYTTYTGTVTVAGADITANVTLTQTRTISFTINDGTDAIQGAEVVIDGDTAGKKTTGSSGGCTATLADGEHEVVISKTGYTTKTQTITTDSTHTTFTISLTEA